MHARGLPDTSCVFDLGKRHPSSAISGASMRSFGRTHPELQDGPPPTLGDVLSGLRRAESPHPPRFPRPPPGEVNISKDFAPNGPRLRPLALVRARHRWSLLPRTGPRARAPPGRSGRASVAQAPRAVSGRSRSSSDRSSTIMLLHSPFILYLSPSTSLPSLLSCLSLALARTRAQSPNLSFTRSSSHPHPHTHSPSDSLFLSTSCLLALFPCHIFPPARFFRLRCASHVRIWRARLGGEVLMASRSTSCWDSLQARWGTRLFARPRAAGAAGMRRRRAVAAQVRRLCKGCARRFARGLPPREALLSRLRRTGGALPARPRRGSGPRGGAMQGPCGATRGGHLIGVWGYAGVGGGLNGIC